MIRLRKINRVFPLKGGPFYALRDINLEIRGGDFLSIMGPSGSGKSTLLHILGLHDSAWSGEYDLVGQPVHQADKKKRFALQKKHIGFVFQSYHLLDDLTVYENLEIPLSYRDTRGRIARALSATRSIAFTSSPRRTSIRISSPAASSSSSASRAPWSPIPRSFSRTNRPAIFTPTRAAKSCSCSRNSTRRMA